MQYKVPQNIDIEDRVIGPLTLRQFTILLIATGISIFYFAIFQGPLRFLAWLLALITIALAVVIGFVKYGDQNFEIFLMSAFKTFTSPRKRVWRVETVAERPKEESTQGVPATKKERTKKAVEEVRDDLGRLAEVVDSGGHIAAKDRIIAGEQTKTEDKETPDLLQKVEEPHPTLEKIIDTFKPKIKREPTVSEMSAPAKEYNYPSINIRKK